MANVKFKKSPLPRHQFLNRMLDFLFVLHPWPTDSNSIPLAATCCVASRIVEVEEEEEGKRVRREGGSED